MIVRAEIDMTSQFNLTRTGPTTSLTFSTEDVAPRDRLAIWREVLGRVHLHLDVEPAVEGPLRATVESHRWTGTSLYFSDTTAVRASRTRELVQDGDCDFRLLLSRGAGYCYRANGDEHVVEDGQAALLFNGVVSSVQYLGSCHVTAVRVRRADLEVAVRNLDERPIRRANSGSAAYRLLIDYVDVLRKRGPVSDPILGSRIAAHLSDLVALAIGPTRDACEIARGRGVPAARLAAIKERIETHLPRQDLSAEVVARQEGVSARYVRMLFEGDGSSFSDHVLERRLARACDLLRDPRLFERTIGSIAYDAGFNDLSYFNRSFRRRFGCTPSDFRAQARQSL
jgi:AraC-like DNA-binding protein